ncbi:MAG: protein-export chaperone SecB [Oleiphilaceae bacterium]|nr:protein-export chaperone SecB [Oleiphilaceae bacterium]
MAENESAPENQQAAQDQQAHPGFAMQRIYVKDISFESPNSPVVFQKNWKPEVKMDLNTKNGQVGEGLYEVVVAVTLTATVDGMTAYIIEVQQAGIFQVQGFEGPQLGQALGAFCPNLLFPYLRETIDNILVKGSFPAMMLGPVNFDAIYAQAMMQKQQEAAAAGAEAQGSGETPSH